MISKNETKYIQSLYHKKVRDEAELFIAEGVKLVDELLHSGFVIRKYMQLKNGQALLLSLLLLLSNNMSWKRSAISPPQTMY
jgi:tRNA G18 (ribose-2'-O)-methylase SpoU